ncbi:MAG: hypothetical protein AAF443_01035 [Chlamydiota bacterium]
MSTSTETFITVSKDFNHLYFPLICKFFKNRIASLYGNQDKAIDKIKKGEDRACEIMLICDDPIGFIVYKTELQDEFDLKDSFELKTLALFHPEVHSGKGYGSLLYDRVDYLARNKSAHCIFCTVNVNSKNPIKCLLKNKYKLKKKVTENNFLAVKNLCKIY